MENGVSVSQLGNLQQADALLARGRARDRLRGVEERHEFWLRESDGMMERWRKGRDRTAASTS